MLGRECLCDQPPIKTLGSESLMTFSSRYRFHVCYHKSLLEELSVTYVLWERTLRSLHLVSSDFPHMPFSFADFAFYPYTVISLRTQLYARFRECFLENY